MTSVPPQNAGIDYDRLFGEISGYVNQILGLWRDPDFPRDLTAPEMFIDTLRIAQDFTNPAFYDRAGSPIGDAPWRYGEIGVAAKHILDRMQAVLLRRNLTENLESLCYELLELEIQATQAVRNQTSSLPSNLQEINEIRWEEVAETLAQKQVILITRRQNAALRSDLAEIKQVASEVAQVAAESRENAGTVGELELATYFEELAKDERKAANLFRLCAIAILVASATLVYLASFDNSLSTGEIIRHVAFALPALGLSTYLGAEATKHRRSAQWAETVKVQLRTVGLFCAPMDPESATAVRQHLASRVFGALPGEASEGSADAQVTSKLLEQLVELVRGSKSS
ncbi:hypothetical protein [Kribbella karoonensis]|uniref:Uncharacterized protein n=1 Tax=Kribbella karoonensis TaxID=324851 RepID=A0ABN2E2W4_9ACTN